MSALIWHRPLRPIVGLGQPLSAADQQRLDQARALLPKDCYSKEFDDCIFKKVPTNFPRCAELNQLWGDNKQDPVYIQLEALADALPYCPAPVAPSPPPPNFLLIGAGVLAAVALAFFLMRR